MVTRILFIISFLFAFSNGFCQLSPVDSLKVKYVDWLIGTSDDYAVSEVMQRYNRYLTNGNAARDLSAYDLQNPGAIWDLTNATDRSSYSTLVETKLIRLVYLYKLSGPVATPNAAYHTVGLRDTILDIFAYMKDKGVSSTTNFNMYIVPAQEMLETYNSVALRSSAYAVSILLMKEELQQAGEFDHHMGALNNLTGFLSETNPVFNFTYPGFNTDVTRSTTVQRFCYVLALDDTVSNRQSEMVHLQQFMNHSLKIGYGWADCIKPDFTTFHHKGIYTNTYGINALQIMAIMDLILNGTSFELSAEAKSNLKQAIMNYPKFSIDYTMPRGTSGRFPTNLTAINELRPAFAYLYLTDPVQHEDMGREFMRLWGISTTQNTNLIRSATLSIVNINGLQGAKDMKTVLDAGLTPGNEQVGHFGFPYGGFSVHKRPGFQLNFKGSSKHIWDYENSATENVFGRYLSAGGMDIVSRGNPVSYDSSGLSLANGWDWSHFPGTTTAYLPYSQLGPATHRLFSNRNFIGNATFDTQGTFALDYTDNYSPTDMSALKSYFAVDNKILCLGSGIQDTNGVAPIHTTLFQTVLDHPDSATYVNGTAQTGLNYSFSQTGGSIWLTDAIGNGYVVPAASFNSDSIVVKRAIQNSRNHSNTANTSGNVASAYIHHGTSPVDASYQYAVIVNGGTTQTADLAQHFSDYFQVIRLDRKAHAALYVPDSIHSYTVFDTSAVFLNDWIRNVSKPAVVLTQPVPTTTKLKISLTNPDLGLLSDTEFYQYNQIGGNVGVQNRIPQPADVSVVLEGEWELDQPETAVTVSYDGTTYTTVTFETIHGKTIQTVLKRILPSTIGIGELAAGKVTVYPNPTKGLVYVDMKAGDLQQWSVCDSRGAELSEKITLVKEAERVAFDFGQLAPGMYMLLINDQLYRIFR